MIKLQKKFKVVILDFTKTLVMFDANWGQLRKINAEIFAKTGIKIDYQSLRPVIEQTASQLAYLKNLNYSQEKILQIEKELIKAQEQFEENSIDSISLYSDAQTFLKSAAQNNLQMAILTNNLSSTAKKAFSKLNTDFNGLIIGRENVKYPKPNPEGILKLLNQLKVSAGNCIFVGDSDFDIDVAKNVGCFSIFIKRSPEMKLSYTKADFIITSLEELVFNY